MKRVWVKGHQREMLSYNWYSGTEAFGADLTSKPKKGYPYKRYIRVKGHYRKIKRKYHSGDAYKSHMIFEARKKRRGKQPFM